MSPPKRAIAILAIALAYLITARLGLLFALPPGFATAYWPPAGIAIAAILLYGYAIWPGIFFGALIANLLTPINSLNISLIASTGIALGSTCQALAIGYLLRTWTNSETYLLNTRRNIISFLFFTVVCCTISSTISLTILYSSGVIPSQSFGANWVTWWLGDTTGIFVFAPFLFSWGRPFAFKTFSHLSIEAFFLFLITIGVGLLCFGGWLTAGYPIAYLMMPWLIWAALRFSAPVVTTLLVLISLIAIWGTAHGYGPFARPTLNESLLLLQAYLGVFAATTLILLSVMNEIWHAQKVLEEYSQELKAQVKHLRKKDQL